MAILNKRRREEGEKREEEEEEEEEEEDCVHQLPPGVQDHGFHYVSSHTLVPSLPHPS